MAATGQVRGRCLCGAVRFAAEVSGRDIDACHCEMCRRWSSGPFIGLSHDGAVTLEGEDSIGVYRSSEWGERAFCTKCGSALFWRLHGTDHYAFSAGAIEDQSDLKMVSQIFIDEKPAYYDFANDTPKLTGAEVAAAFSAKAPKE